MFDRMLGLEKDPRLIKIRAENPLNNIAVPKGRIDNLDERIDQFYIPIDHEGETMHPLLHVN